MELNVKIAGVSYRTTNQYQISEQSGAVSNSKIDVRLDNNPPPLELSKIEIYDPNNSLFYVGIIQNVDFPEYSSRYETQIYTVTSLSLNSIFNNRLVSESYEDKYTHEIVSDLFTKYLVDEGLTLGTITTFGRRYDTYVANRLKLSDVLNELAGAVGAIPIIDNSLAFHFVDKTSFPSKTPPNHIRALRKASDAKNLRTVQYISGASEDTSLQTKSFTWTAGQTEIPLPYQLSSVVGVSINGTPAGVGFVGLDSSDPAKTFLWSYGAQTIALNSGATIKPSTGDNVVAVFYGYYAVEVESKNLNLIEDIKARNGTSGRIEVVNIDQTIKSTFDGEQAAIDLLNANGVIEETVDLICHDAEATTLLSTWYLNYPDLYIVGEYVVVERLISDRYDVFTIQVKLKNKGFTSRYGTVYNKNNKTINNLTIRPNELVQKYGSFQDIMSTSETWLLLNGGLLCYPGVASGEIFATQNLGDFYPS